MIDKHAPVFLLAGGPGSREKKGPDPLFRHVFQQTGIQKPTVAYIGAASGDNPVFRLWLSKVMQKAGAGKVTLAPLYGRKGDPEKARAVIEASDLIFISGGDVDEGMRVLREKEMIGILRHHHQAGKPFFGMSAGSIMLARQWIRWTDEDDDASAELFDCLGFAPIFCDTHGEDDGWEELKALIGCFPSGTTGYGIISGAAVVVKPEGTVSALGGKVHRFRRQDHGVVQIEDLVPGKNIR